MTKIEKALELVKQIRTQLEINVQIAEQNHPEGPIVDGKRLKGLAHSQDLLAQHIRDHLTQLEETLKSIALDGFDKKLTDFITSVSEVSLPEEDYKNHGYASVDDFIADREDEALCADYQEYMDTVREARKLRKEIEA